MPECYVRIMPTKVCTKCGETKDVECFHKMSKSRDGRQPLCKDCRRETDHEVYLKRSPEQRSRYAAANIEQYEKNRRTAYEYLLKHPCVDCREGDPVVLEFDHVRGTKRNHVATLIRRCVSTETLLKEIAKCDVRCANCHRRKTAKKRKDKRYRWYNGR
jgi:hypothetical protein